MFKTAVSPLTNDVEFFRGMPWGVSFISNEQKAPTVPQRRQTRLRGHRHQASVKRLLAWQSR